MKRSCTNLFVVFVFYLLAISIASGSDVNLIGHTAFLEPASFGVCSARCGIGDSVTCDGSSCSAQDDVGCRYKDTDGKWKRNDCPLGLAEANTNENIETNDKVLANEILLLHTLWQASHGNNRALGEIYLGEAAATCTADCGGGRSISCEASGKDSCFAIDGVACQIYHDGGELTHVSCNY